MKFPPLLKKNNTIAITCPSGFLEKEKCYEAIEQFKKWGLNVIVGNTVGNGTNYFAGTDEERRHELQSMLDDASIDCIFMGRGGYGMSRIIDNLDFKKFNKNPKWICGFSDITLLHLHLQKNGYASIHSPMCVAFQKEDNKPIIDYLKKTLFGKPSTINYKSEHQYAQIGSVTSEVIGGNLAMLTHAIGSSSFPNTKGKILFIEDIGEHLYKIDRMMIQLSRAGILKNLSGIIFGQFTDVEDTTRPFGVSLYELLRYHTAKLDIPVAFDFPAGHVDINYSIILGATYELTVKKNDTKFRLIQQSKNHEP